MDAATTNAIISGRELDEDEKVWRNLYPWLLDCGYKLRHRYEPGWVPSWGEGKRILAEDSVPPAYAEKIMDATRLVDGRCVVLKLTPTYTKEVPLVRLFSSPKMLADKRNPTPPLLDLLPLPEDDERALLILPLLRGYSDPSFETVGEILVCIRSLLEGLAFLHEHNLAHMDIDGLNTMMLPSENMFIEGFHPSQSGRRLPNPNSLKMKDGFPPFTSRTIAPCRYYLIDFGEAYMFPSFDDRGRLTGKVGHRTHTVPDFQLPDYDPFELDIRRFGDMLHNDILGNRDGLEFLRPFVASLRANNPALRPPAARAVEMLDSLIRTLSISDLRRYPPFKDDLPSGLTGLQVLIHRFQIFLLRRPPLYTWEMEDNALELQDQVSIVRRLWRQFALSNWWIHIAMIGSG